MGSALVMFTQYGFGLVETGFTRKRNAARTTGINVAIFGTAFAAFFVVGYALMFGVTAAVVGSIAAILVVEAVLFIDRHGVDDPVGAVAVHG
jgi:ammonia channel protein AmtB